MTRKKGTEYSPEFKQEAVQLAIREGMTIKQAAKDLGLTDSVLHGWVQQAITASLLGRPAFTGKGKPTLSDQELLIKELEKENAILRLLGQNSTQNGAWPQERESLKLLT